MKDGFRIAVVGATGAVGRQLISILEQRRFPVQELVPIASKRSEGKFVSLSGKQFPCKSLQKGVFDGIDIAFFDVSDAISKEWVPQAAAAGAWVIDNSATFRYEEDIPLLVPEVNGELLKQKLKETIHSARQRILAGPNCVAAPLALALKPIHEKWGLKRVVVSTYQSTSGAGAAAMEELRLHTQAYLKDQTFLKNEVFPHSIAFNCIPHIGGFKSDGNTGEEQKVIAETRKILGLPQLRISISAVRVPTFSCHGESVNIECEKPFSIRDVQSALIKQEGIVLQDEPETNQYPLGLVAPDDRVEGATGKDAVYVGRVRADYSVDHGLNLWLVSDNLRKGAALNAVQIGEALLRSLH